jgi:hypothetical protein
MLGRLLEIDKSAIYEKLLCWDNESTEFLSWCTMTAIFQASNQTPGDFSFCASLSARVSRDDRIEAW